MIPVVPWSVRPVPKFVSCAQHPYNCHAAPFQRTGPCLGVPCTIVVPLLPASGRSNCGCMAEHASDAAALESRHTPVTAYRTDQNQVASHAQHARWNAVTRLHWAGWMQRTSIFQNCIIILPWSRSSPNRHSCQAKVVTRDCKWHLRCKVCNLQQDRCRLAACFGLPINRLALAS